MAKLIATSNFLSIVIEKDIVNCVIGPDNDSLRISVLNQECLEPDVKHDEDTCIQCCCISLCEKYLALCFKKELAIYKTDDWMKLCCCKVDRNASDLHFLPLSKYLLLADKSGSAVFYSFSECNIQKVNELAIAHNSMLTGALVSADEKYILTCDRDEKVRVTQFPNVYTIQSYCLGHKQFITGMTFLPVDCRVLVTGSGDGTIRFWDYIAGIEIFVTSNETCAQPVPIVKVAAAKLLKKDGLCSLVAGQMYMSCSLKLLEVKGNLDNPLEISEKEIILSSVPMDICFFNSKLIYLLQDENPLQSLNASESFVDKISQYLHQNFDTVLKTQTKCDWIPLLYKREFDNVQEYHQRKKLRINKTSNDVETQ